MDSLLRVLRDPASMPGLTGTEWTGVMQRARRRALVGKLGALAQDSNCFEALPAAVQRQFASMVRLAEHNGTHLMAEAFQVLFALRDIETPVVFLKGAAYAQLGLKVDRGRVSSDIDILVPKDSLDAVEAALQRRDWQPMKLDDYDQAYYRRWMHELPPMRHRYRATVIDVHHTILPLTGRVTPQPSAMIRDAVPVDIHGRPGLVPCREDLVVHAAAHLFQDGDLNERLRDLLDIRQLVEEFSADNGFWDRLVARANLHDCSRAVFYALQFAQTMLGADVPPRALKGLDRPPGPVSRWSMDTLVPAALMPSPPDRAKGFAGVARWLLFLRSHWLRMPPLILARHLTIKAWRSLLPR